MKRHGKRLGFPDYGRDEIRRDFAGHRMTVVRDDGLHRHMQFRGINSWLCWFDIVTWPGVLVINGDCGCYAFARVANMFAFFRNAEAAIAPDYWSGKLLATDRDDGHRQYSEHLGRSAVAQEARRLRANGADNAAVLDFVRSVETDGDERALIHSAREWAYDEWRVEDFYPQLTDFTRRFLWNCHAIVWAIAQYDASKAPTATKDQP